LQFVKPKEASKEDILLVHSQRHYEYVLGAIEKEKTVLDSGDTYAVKDSLLAAMLAAGSVIHGVELVLNKEYQNVFCMVRPPGHHAESSRPMGFCLFNNIAIGAQYAINNHDLKRVAIIDWDVHHGNGTQEIFYETDNVFYISLHQYPFYPGTGSKNETGAGAGAGCTMNFPLQAGTGGDVYRKIFEDDILTLLESYRPQLLMISAGFDAHKSDPLGGMMLTEEDFGDMTKILRDFCTRCGIGIVSVLEGGYNPQALAASIRQHLTNL